MIKKKKISKYIYLILHDDGNCALHDSYMGRSVEFYYTDIPMIIQKLKEYLKTLDDQNKRV